MRFSIFSFFTFSRLARRLELEDSLLLERPNRARSIVVVEDFNFYYS